MGIEAIKGLKPELIWKRFFEITQVPRPSKKEEKIREYVRNFAKENNFKMKEDKVGNIVIHVPAVKGYEKSPTVVLQGHLDMVCEKNKGTKHDFDNDPIEIYRDGDWITAKGTTLGADNGIGVAAGLAIATDKTAVHGPLEILCTIDEETGMTGVNELQKGFIKGKTLLNLDSEEDGAFYVGCSGGQDTLGYFDIEYARARKGTVAFELMVTGLKGGHSGLDIQNGRANAIRLLAQLLSEIEVPFQIAKLKGGSLRNAIPREAEAVILIKPEDKAKVAKTAREFVKKSLLEFATNDGGLNVKLKAMKERPGKVYKKEFADKIVKVLIAIPHGIMAMSPDIPDLVETSTNLATVTEENGKVKIGTSQRSSVESAKWNVTKMVCAVIELGGGKAVIGDSYPGWQPNMDSKLLQVSKNVYKKLFKKEPEIKAIHAGLETGLLGSKFPGLDMISFGPTIEGAHSPDERVNIKDVEKFYKLLKEILKTLK
ncbi:MAG: aminoacyl-histidine dipeptidase [Chlorobi bacterium]|nr:aminoacyl-histidine dipeptidase [Chlorobiota bacterium]